KIPNYRQPTWPEGNIPQQIHLDFFVNDIKDVENQVLKLGATKTDFQPGSPPEVEGSLEFRVYLDPEGHPFCLIFRPE
ncbi:MAG: VOC family protein, partial [Actinomycetes bacterium]